jgi:hypothetical protein
MSILGAASIIIHVLRKEKAERRLYHRIMLWMSLTDLFGCFGCKWVVMWGAREMERGKDLNLSRTEGSLNTRVKRKIHLYLALTFVFKMSRPVGSQTLRDWGR